MKYLSLILLLAIAGLNPARAASPLPPSNLRILTQPPLPGTLVNGSFESDYIGWTFTGNQAINGRASDGIKAVQFNSGQTTPDGVLAQSFATTPGQSYLLAFDVGADWGTPATSQSLQVTVSGKGTVLSQTVTVFGTGSSSSAYTPANFTFVADSGTTTLTFQDVSSTGLNVDLLLDNVRVSAQTVPVLPPVVGPIVRVLTVASVNSGNVNVTVSPVDQAGAGNGIPAFNRTYNNATIVSLGVPSASGGNTFLKWQKDGVDFSTSPSITVTMDRDHTLNAVFGTTQIAANTGAWYVSPNGNDSNDGLTYATAFATPARALAQVNAGSNSVVLLGPGTYNASSSLFVTRSGTPANPITVCALNSNVWPPDVTLSNPYTDVLTLNEVSNVCVKNIKIAGAFNGGHRAIYGHFYNSTYKGVVIERCEMVNHGYGIFLETDSDSGTDGAIIRSNYVHDLQLAGIYTRRDKWTKSMRFLNTQITYNTVSNITGDATHELGSGILLNMTSNSYLYGNLVVRTGYGASNTGGGPGGIIVAYSSGGYIGWNAVGEVRWCTGSHVDGVGINPGPAADSMVFEHNYIWNCDGAGYLDNTQDGISGTNTCRYNTIVNCGLRNQSAIRVVGSYSDGSTTTGFRILNNTIVSMQSGALPIYIGPGQTGTNLLVNNIIISTNAPVLQMDGTSWVVKDNCYYDKDRTTTYSWKGTTYTGLPAFRNASGQETGTGLEMDPPLNDEETVVAIKDVGQISTIQNYRPVAGSPVLKNGAVGAYVSN